MPKPEKSKLEKLGANGNNNAGWAVLWASLGHDTRTLSKMGQRGGRETARMNNIRSKAKITPSMRQEAAALESIDAYHSGFRTVEEYKQH